jgi:glutaconate CoA-transferase subunit A
LLGGGPAQSLLINRAMVAAVVETRGGAHFTSCVPDYGRDEAFQARYAKAAASPQAWEEFRAEFLSGGEDGYQQAVARYRQVRA